MTRNAWTRAVTMGLGLMRWRCCALPPVWGSVLLALLALGQAKVAWAAPQRVKVKYVHSQRVFLDAGTAEGLTPGALLEVVHQGKRVAKLRVESATAKQAAAVFVSRNGMPEAGDQVKLKSAWVPLVLPAAPVKVAPLPTPVDPRAKAQLQRQPFHKVDFERSAPPPLRTRFQAYLRSNNWVYLTSVPTAVTAEQRLQVRLDAPLDPRGHWQVAVDAQVVGRPIQPRYTQFEGYHPVAMEVYEASLAYHGLQGLDLGLGRRAAAGLRYALLDGVYAA